MKILHDGKSNCHIVVNDEVIPGNWETANNETNTNHGACISMYVWDSMDYFVKIST